MLRLAACADIIIIISFLTFIIIFSCAIEIIIIMMMMGHDENSGNDNSIISMEYQSLFEENMTRIINNTKNYNNKRKGSGGSIKGKAKNKGHNRALGHAVLMKVRVFVAVVGWAACFLLVLIPWTNFVDRLNIISKREKP